MKKILITLLAVFTWVSAFAGNDYSKYYNNLPIVMPRVVTPSIPDTTMSVLDFGGKGDAITLNTAAFEKGIAALNKIGGGHLNVPAGVYLTGIIELKDNIDLHLDKNAIIVFSPDKEEMFEMIDSVRAKKTTTWITASKRRNISITGEGTIDGNGEWWRPVKRGKVSDTEWNKFKSMGGTITPDGKLWYPFNLKHFKNVADSYTKQEKLRTHLIRFTNCDNVLIKGVTLMNSPKFHLIPTRCRNVIIDGITVKCPWNAQNGDAIDLSSCQNVLIVNNVIDAGDDGICMKAGIGEKGLQYGPVKNVIIENNHVYHAHGGFVVGSEFSGGLENIIVRNNTFTGTDTGLRFKSAVKRGGTTKNIFIDNIFMTDIKDEAIVFQTTYWDNHVGAKGPEEVVDTAFTPHFQDIHINNVVVRGCNTAIRAKGGKGMIQDINIKDSYFFYTNRKHDIDSECLVNVENVDFQTFPDVKVDGLEPPVKSEDDDADED